VKGSHNYPYLACFVVVVVVLDHSETKWCMSALARDFELRLLDDIAFKKPTFRDHTHNVMDVFFLEIRPCRVDFLRLLSNVFPQKLS
jgi:hypothetical protein